MQSADPEYFKAVVLLESGGKDLGAGGRDAVIGDVKITDGFVEPSTAT